MTNERSILVGGQIRNLLAIITEVQQENQRLRGLLAEITQRELMSIENQQQANARLIAAAPDMLEVLKGLLFCAEQPLYVEHETFATIFPNQTKALRSAIAKAEGQEARTP